MTWFSNFLILFLSLLPAVTIQAAETGGAIRFYIHAHQDDWQLFMADEVLAHLPGDRGTVFVYTTAGDRGDEQKYWQAREIGALASQMLLADAARGTQSSLACGELSLRGHSLRRCVYGATVAYFMRLPDGGSVRSGKGFPRYGDRSLQILKEQSCATPPCSLTAVDNSTSYATWEDFVLTLGEIIRHESVPADAGEFWINAPDFDSAKNPGDHSDHLHTGLAVRDIGQQLDVLPEIRGRLRFAWYADYDIANRAADVSAAGYLAKAGAFLAYDRKVWEAMEFSTLCKAYDIHTRFLQRSYFRLDQQENK